MKNPYQPPDAEGAAEEASTSIRRSRIRDMVVMVSVATTLAGGFVMWQVERYSVAFRALRDDPPVFLPEWLWFAWRDADLLLWWGVVVVSIAVAFLHVDKRSVVLGRVALGLSLLGAVIVFGWTAILAMGAVTR